MTVEIFNTIRQEEKLVKKTVGEERYSPLREDLSEDSTECNG